ncbi:NUDIX domain-containing protein [Pimelobacter simplex]|uniref:NUDIX domain-containing protein n=1 Tax=Nocardioides simplex TaxID=2045 RepID=UPI001933B33A|nr:NUDIX hydrolase [Pimelobacter simplex]
MSELRDVPESWPVEDSVDLHRDGWVVAFRSDRIRRPGAEDEEPFRRLVLEHPGAAVVLAIDAEDRVLCLRQYRHPAQYRLVELPAGVIDHPGENPEDVARRELREEAALAAQRWTHLLSTLSSPGYSAERIHYYLAEDLAPADRGDFELRHEEADLEVFWVPFADLVDAILAGEVTDGPVVQAVLAVQVRRDRESARG